MIRRKAYKFRLKPNTEQLCQLNSIAGHCRFLWNKVLRLNLSRLENKQRMMWYQETDFWSKRWKASNEYGFLKGVPAHCIQQKLRDLDKAFRDAFDKSQPLKRMPRFKKQGLGDSFRFPEAKQIQIENRRVKLPKLGWMGFFKSQVIKGKLKQATVTRKGGKWYISFQVEQDVEKPTHPKKSSVGVDLGIERFVVLSNGQSVDPIHVFRRYSHKLAKAQRRLSRKQKFSANWKKQRARVQKIHSKIAAIRLDFQHKLSTHLSKSHAMIVVESLKILNMSASASGTIDSPGKNVKAKSGLNKSILDQAWGEFKRQLKYKLEWLGGLFLEVPAAYTSQRCPVCQHISQANRKSQEKFCCIRCGHKDNADINAAKNILAVGHAVLACGEEALAPSMKQEPLGTGNLIPAC